MELSFLPLAFDPSLTVASRLLNPQFIEDQTRGFIGETVIHRQQHSEKFTELYREEKREEGDRGDQEERRGTKKERD